MSLQEIMSHEKKLLKSVCITEFKDEIRQVIFRRVARREKWGGKAMRLTKFLQQTWFGKKDRNLEAAQSVFQTAKQFMIIIKSK